MTAQPVVIEAWLDGGPDDGRTERVAHDCDEIVTGNVIRGFEIYRRRPRGEVIVPKTNADHGSESSYVFAAYFDHEGRQ